MTAIDKPSTEEIEKLMNEATDLEYRDIAHEIMVAAKSWKSRRINEDRLFFEIRKSIAAGIKRRNLIRKSF